MLTGFFQTWYPLMFNFSVLKNGSYLDMEKIDDGYRFTGQHDSTRLIMVFTPDSD